jgi:dienelactone hydrolase
MRDDVNRYPESVSMRAQTSPRRGWAILFAPILALSAVISFAQTNNEALAQAEKGGSGPYAAVMVGDPTLPTHTIYRPRDLNVSQSGRLPIVVWANGGCANDGNRFRYFLTEIASHGYLVVAIGPIGPSSVEGPYGPPPPATAAPPIATQPTPAEIAKFMATHPPLTQAKQLNDAIDWAVGENSRKAGPYFGKLNTKEIAVMGQSCGGLQAILASADPRTTTTVIWNSGTPPGSNGLPGADAVRANLADLHAPIAYFSGDASDIAYQNSNEDFDALPKIPAFRAFEKGVGHGGTYQQPNGGTFGKVAVAWLDWQLKGDAIAGHMFTGADCLLCTDPQWVVRKRNLDPDPSLHADGRGANTAVPGLGAEVQPNGKTPVEGSIASIDEPHHRPAGWIVAGTPGVLPRESSYADPLGEVETLSVAGAINRQGHPFFTPLGSNGRACVTCHQPSDGMSISAATAQERWKASYGHDPLFAMVDGANCPSLPENDPASHSLLLDRGLFRIALPWPPRRPDGSAIDPDISIEVLRDPTGCNTSDLYGLHSARPMISVYRRPRAVGNLAHIISDLNVPQLPILKHFRFTAKAVEDPYPLDPSTGKMRNPNIMADARFDDLGDQAFDAAINHLGAKGLSAAQRQQIVAFEMQLYVAQSANSVIGPLDGEHGAPNLGPGVIAATKPMPGGAAFGFTPSIWADVGSSDPQDQFRQSVRRGFTLFNQPVMLRNVQHINSVGLGNPTKRACSLCHTAQMVGTDGAAGWIDIGVQNLPWAADDPSLPLFKVTCKPGAQQHMFLGPVIYTHDPGRALVTGKCFDVGAIVAQQFRGLAARAPYFSNGSAASLREVVDFYDRRFDIHYTDQQKQDLVNFLSVL